MKRWILASLVMPLVLAACGSNNSSSGTTATVPPPTNCIDGSAYCNSNYYNQNNGYSAYPYNPYYYGSTGNFCNCPVGYRPVYNANYGLGCVSMSSFQPYAYGAVYWGWGANNNQWVNIPQVSNTQGYPSSSSCYQNIAQSCFVDQVNSCGAGATCQPTAGGSRLGVCLANGTTLNGAGTGAAYR